MTFLTVLTNQSSTQTIVLDRLESTAQLYTPTVISNNPVALNLLGPGTVVYNPSVSATASILPNRLESTAVINSHTLSATNNIAPQFLSAGSVIYLPSLSATANILANSIVSSGQIYAPTVAPVVNIDLNIIPTTQMFFDAVLAQQIPRGGGLTLLGVG